MLQPIESLLDRNTGKGKKDVHCGSRVIVSFPRTRRTMFIILSHGRTPMSCEHNNNSLAWVQGGLDMNPSLGFEMVLELTGSETAATRHGSGRVVERA